MAVCLDCARRGGRRNGCWKCEELSKDPMIATRKNLKKVIRGEKLKREVGAVWDILQKMKSKRNK